MRLFKEPSLADHLERPITAIGVDEGEYRGAWLAPVSRLIYPHHSERAMEEMRHGRAQIKAQEGDVMLAGLPIKFADEETWNMILGLCVCGLGKRIDL